MEPKLSYNFPGIGTCAESYDIPGHDIGEIYDVKTVQECDEECIKDSNCNHFIWVGKYQAYLNDFLYYNYLFNQTNTNLDPVHGVAPFTCYLKSGSEGYTYAVGIDSGHQGCSKEKPGKIYTNFIQLFYRCINTCIHKHSLKTHVNSIS